MGDSLIFNLYHVFKNVKIDVFMEAYIERIKKSVNPIVKKIVKNNDNQYEIIFSKKMPDFLHNFLNINTIDYTEKICKKNENVEISTFQNIGMYNFKCLTIVKYDENQNIILNSLINVNRFPYILQTILKKYIENNFKNDRNIEENILQKLL